MTVLVVLDLDFRPGLPLGGRFLGRMKHNPAVASLGDLVFEGQLERGVLADGHDGAGTP